MQTLPWSSCRDAVVRVALVLLACGVTRAGTAEEYPGGSRGFPPAIEDNSFFIEEAYNQEKGVVQHISNFIHFGSASSHCFYGFTQEWPMGGQRHQLSYTIPYSWADSSGDSGMGDFLLNYRYQLLGHDAWAAVSPRLSLIIPSGSRRGGSPGVQVNLPASKRLSAHAVVHANAGFTFLPGDRGHAYNVGGSAIALVTKDFNVMLELVSTITTEREDGSAATRTTETILSPGVRYAVNVGSLQIVPGIAVPIRRNGGKMQAGLFAYLSFEHPFN